MTAGREGEVARFADSAARLYGQCALVLGWRPDEFWAATPADIAAIRDAMSGPEKTQGVSRAEIDRLMEIENGQ